MLSDLPTLPKNEFWSYRERNIDLEQCKLIHYSYIDMSLFLFFGHILLLLLILMSNYLRRRWNSYGCHL